MSSGPAAPAENSRYQVRVTLPDGRTLEQTLDTGEEPRSPVLSIYVPAAAVENLRPEQVAVQAVVTTAEGAVISNALKASIADFPTPSPAGPPPDRGPFGWGQPLPATGAAALPHAGPTGLAFVRIPPEEKRPAFFLSTTEASNQQLAAIWKEYKAPSNRSDEFALESPAQPAFGLTPAQAQTYLDALTKADGTGPVYRLPTREEWLWSARAGQASAFWWGDEPSFPAGANFLGPEPALNTDATAPCLPPSAPPTFRANAWGLYHTFGNIAEWARDPVGFFRMGGHFRTEPAVPLSEPVVKKADETGPDLFVGVRPAFDLPAAAATAALRAALAADRGLAAVTVRFDPARATAILTGEVEESALRRRADTALKRLWWLAAVENRLTTPEVAPGHLARLGPKIDARRLSTRWVRYYSRFGLRLMSPVDDVKTIPTDGKNQIIVANVRNVLHFRIFDSFGEMVVNNEENQLAEKAPQIAALKTLLKDFWTAAQLSASDKDRIVTAVASLFDHTPYWARSYRIVPIEVRWAATLPVSGSSWTLNILSPAGALSYDLAPPEIGQAQRLEVPLDRARLPGESSVTVVLSLGGPAERRRCSQRRQQRAVPDRAGLTLLL